MIPELARKLWSLFTPTERRQALGLLLLMLLGTAFEVIGVGLVFPVVALLASPDALSQNMVLAGLHRWITPETPNRFIAAVLAGLVGVFALKNLFLAFVAYCQSRFMYNKQAALSVRLFSHYLAQPYAFHLNRNSAELLRNLTLDAERLATQVLLPGIVLIAECLVGVGLIALLLTISPMAATLVAGLSGVSSYLVFRALRRRLTIWGEQVQFHDGKRFQHLQQGLGAIKDVKACRREDYFKNRYALHAFARSRYVSLQYLLSSFPLLWLEICAVAGLLGIVAIMLFDGWPLASILPTLGVFTAATFRLMPTMNRILVALQNLKFCGAVIDTLYREIHAYPVGERAVAATMDTEETPDAAAMIELKNVGYRYAAGTVDALCDIDLTVRPGETIGIMGASGSGKTTLLDVMLGLLEASRGTVRVGAGGLAADADAWRQGVGYIPQNIYLMDDSVRRNVAFGLSDDAIDDARVWRALETARLTDFVRAQPGALDAEVGERGIRLSGGQRQRIGIARALYYDPPILILDEATAALDSVTEMEFMAAIETIRTTRTLVIVAHRLSTLQNCDRVVELKNGRVVRTGSYRELVAQD